MEKENWTPDIIRNPDAEKWQARFYGAGLLTGAVTLMALDGREAGAGAFLGLSTVVLFAIGSGIKTVWRKEIQVDFVVIDREREQLRGKWYMAAIMLGLVAVLVLASGGGGFGGVLGGASIVASIVGASLPVRLVKVAEGGGYGRGRR